MRGKIAVKKLVFYAAIIVVWQIVFSLNIWSVYIFPSPVQVAQDLAYGAAEGTLFFGIATSIWRLLVGLAISIAGGITLGVFMARVESVNQTIGSLVLGLQSIPSVAWVPLALLWFGLNDSGIIFVTVASSLFAVTINTYSGMKN
ncbi:MAG: ABC transporter permease, partial [Nitrosopumilaceae archaeon]